MKPEVIGQLLKNSEVNNKHKNKDGNINIIVSIWSFKHKRFPYGILLKHKSIICVKELIQQWGVNSWREMVQW